MKKQYQLKRKKIILLNYKKVLFCIILLGLILLLPKSLILINSLNDYHEKSTVLKNSSIPNITGTYNGGISTLGIKIEENQSIYNNINQTSIISQNNKTYNDISYRLNRIDIRTYDLLTNTGTIDIAYNHSNFISIPDGYAPAQEFKTPESEEKISIDSVSLYVNHDLSLFSYRTYLYVIYIFDEYFQENLGINYFPVENDEEDRWIILDDIVLTDVLEPNSSYNLVYYMYVEGFGIDGAGAVSENTWKAENKSLTGNDKGKTYYYNGSNFLLLPDSNTTDMLCNLSYLEAVNPEKVNLKYKINDVEYTPIYQKSITAGSSGYEAKLTYNFDKPPTQNVNITVITNKSVEEFQVEIKKYYVYTINASGSYKVSGDMIEWNITYLYYDIGAYKDELRFLYESDWILKEFYNTIGTPIELASLSISYNNETYRSLFDIEGNPLGTGNCVALYQSPNYCENIITKIKDGSEYQENSYLQLGKTIKLEAIIENSFNEPISGGMGNLILRGPSGQIFYNESNLVSYNGILSSSDIILDIGYGVGRYFIDVFWTNGKEVAFYSVSVEVGHPEGYLPPELFILIASLISLTILTIPASIVARKYVRQRNWEKSLHDLFVLTKQGVSMYNFSFGIELKRPELISGMISALTVFIQEATGSKEDLRTIDQQDKKVILNHGEYTIVALISDKDLPIIHKRVKNFTESFENKYGDQLLNWFGETTMFKDAETIVSKFFPVSMEEQRIRGVKMKLIEFRERLLSVDDPMQIISIMRDITEFSSRYQQIINSYSFKDFNELIKIAEQKIKEN